MYLDLVTLNYIVLIVMFHLLLLTDGYVFNINSVGYGFGSQKKSKSCVATTKHYIFVFQVSFVHSVLRIKRVSK